VAGVDVDSHSSQLFHHTSGGRKRGLFLLEKRAKAEEKGPPQKKKNFFKVFETFFTKKNILLISDIRVLIYRLGESQLVRWLHLFPSSMKRSDGGLASALSDYGLIYGTWWVIASLLGGGNFAVELPFPRCDLASGWSDGCFLKPFQIALYRGGLFSNRRGLFFRVLSWLLSSLVWFGFAAYNWSSWFIWQKASSKTFSLCDIANRLYGHGMMFSWKCSRLYPGMAWAITGFFVWVGLAMIPAIYHCQQAWSILGILGKSS